MKIIAKLNFILCEIKTELKLSFALISTLCLIFFLHYLKISNGSEC